MLLKGFLTVGWFLQIRTLDGARRWEASLNMAVKAFILSKNADNQNIDKIKVKWNEKK